MSGILTKSEHEASLRVLRAVRTPVSATVILTWPEEDTRAWVRLARSGYVETVPARSLPKGVIASVRWDRIRATPAGLRYLEQIDEAIREDLSGGYPSNNGASK